MDHDLGDQEGVFGRIRTARRAATSEGRWKLRVSFAQRVDFVDEGTSRVAASLTEDGRFGGEELSEPDRLAFLPNHHAESVIVAEGRSMVVLRVLDSGRRSRPEHLRVTVLPEARERGLREASLLALLGCYRLGVYESPV